MSDSKTPIADALKKPPVLPEQEISIGAVTDGKDIGAKAQANVDIGDPGGWSWLLDAEYWKQKGGQVSTWFKWSGGGK